DSSLVLRLGHAGRAVLFTGDLQAPGMQAVLREHSTLASDILIAPHHGSFEINTPAFVETVDPLAIISSNDRTLSQKQRHFEQAIGGRPLYRTHRDGAVQIRISSEGNLSITPFRNPDSRALQWKP